jgi:Transposase DDE domain
MQGLHVFDPRAVVTVDLESFWSGRVGNSKYLKGTLVYQKEQDRFQCPAGKYLTPTPAITENHKRYVSSSADCRDCALASTCPARRCGSSPRRFALRSLDQDLFEEVQARMRDSTFRTRRPERMWKMEGLFAEAKQNHGLSRARYRGRSKVQIQAYLSVIVQNLKRLVAALWCWLITRSLKQPQRHHPDHPFWQKPDLFNRPVPFAVLVHADRKCEFLRGSPFRDTHKRNQITGISSDR